MLLPGHSAGPARDVDSRNERTRRSDGGVAAARSAVAAILAPFVLRYAGWTTDQLGTLSRATTAEALQNHRFVTALAAYRGMRYLRHGAKRAANVISALAGIGRGPSGDPIMVHINNFTYGALNPVLAYVTSCIGCFIGLRCTSRARASQGRARASWLVIAALAIGIMGIWVMHFIAMLGFTIPGQSIRYSVPVTILSMLIAVAVVGIGLFIVGYSSGGPGPLLLGGLAIGGGVASMHYIGMAAIRAQDTLTYTPVLVAVSVVIAVIAGTAALWAALRLDSAWSAFVASMVMGVAVSGMHYTGMAALRVHATPGLAVTAPASASAEAFLLPLILGICCTGFIFSAVIALSPTAAEMHAEAFLMARLGTHAPGTLAQRERQAEAHDSRQEGGPQPGSLFRDHRSVRQQDEP
jgi:NO-binding membrane sensor protein with MHYT domain